MPTLGSAASSASGRRRRKRERVRAASDSEHEARARLRRLAYRCKRVRGFLPSAKALSAARVSTSSGGPHFRQSSDDALSPKSTKGKSSHAPVHFAIPNRSSAPYFWHEPPVHDRKRCPHVYGRIQDGARQCGQPHSDEQKASHQTRFMTRKRNETGVR